MDQRGMNSKPSPPSRQPSATSSRRRDEIIAISEELFARRGFVGTTVRDIADEADLVPASLYHHFPSKETIADEIMSRYWNDLFAHCRAVVDARADPAATLRGLIEVSIRVIGSRLHAARMMLNDWSYLVDFLPYMDGNMRTLEGIWTTAIREGMAAGVFRADVDPTVAYRTVMSSVSSVGRWYHHGGRLSLDTVIANVESIFLEGLLAPVRRG